MQGAGGGTPHSEGRLFPIFNLGEGTEVEILSNLMMVEGLFSVVEFEEMTQS